MSFNQTLAIDNAVPKFGPIQRTNKALDSSSGITYNQSGYSYNQAGATYGGVYGEDIEKQTGVIINI